MTLFFVNLRDLRCFYLLHNVVVSATFILKVYKVFDVFFKLVLEKIADFGDFTNKLSYPLKGTGGVIDVFN